MRRTKRLESVAYHEAGHAVAAVELRVRIRDLSVTPDTNSSGKLVYYARFGDPNLVRHDTPSFQRKVENVALVACAGPAAQRRFNPKGYRHHDASHDLDAAYGALSHQESNHETLMAYIKLIELRARQFVARQIAWHHIEKLAQTLLDRQRLTDKEIYAVIEASSQEILDGGLQPPRRFIEKP